MFGEKNLPEHTNFQEQEDMIKKYKSRSAISINVVLDSKKSMHIAFTAQSDGGSVYITDNKNVQNALERHYKYGTLFKLAGVEDEASKESQSKETQDTEQEEKNKKRTVKVSDIAAAKDFLADTFGISRTSLRSEKAIREAAEQHNIEFEGLE
jgi:hypothetical protein|nr:MAG TPA: hypothetical protein [Caudoviricetes sp.]